RAPSATVMYCLSLHDALPIFRRAMLEICAAAGWIDASGELTDGRWNGAGPFTEGDPSYQAVYKRIVNHPLFQTWADRHEFVGTRSEEHTSELQSRGQLVCRLL